MFRAREREFLADLYPLLPNPRAAKKFANLYRLVRIEYRDSARLDEYLDGPYQVDALLLAEHRGDQSAARQTTAYRERIGALVRYSFQVHPWPAGHPDQGTPGHPPSV
ncbi:hypothetical protein [Frankia gtarii]|uniref:hypothetical protein n=1 Tax=Frankia gtarii TaxID=2950102 RepID=UPI0021BE49F2|nr:hypothetical protein [Frankia gtarii]